MRSHINIGSNIGNRAEIIDRAVALIRRRWPAQVLRSQPVVSDPWGFDSPNEFLNVGLLVDTGSDAPETVLAHLQTIERQLGATPHRNPDGTYRDRNIDIDLIAMEDLSVDSPSLTLPHPRMADRAFVLHPMAEIDPDWRHPATGLTAPEMLRRLSSSISPKK